jgi:putative lipoprotein
MAMWRRALSFTVPLALLYSGFAFAQNTAVTGTVTYLQRIALPPNAVVKVTLEDVSLADAPAKVLAEKEISTAGKQVPIPFDLAYSSSDLQPSHRYSMHATIKADDKLLFTSTTGYPVLTPGAPSEARIVVQQVPATPSAPQSAAPLEGTHWALNELAGQQVPPATGHQSAYLQFTAEGNRVAGSTGCNRLTGAYQKTGSGLKFNPIATTMMACLGPVMEQENKFKDALNSTTRYRIQGNTLVLLNGKTVLARFNTQAADQQNPNP